MTGPLILNADPTVALGAATKQQVDARQPNFNRLINGDMRIDQRNAGAAVTPTTGTVTYIIDRWAYNSTQGSKFTIGRNGGGQGIVGPADFPYSLGALSDSAYVALASDVFQLFQAIEADMVSDFDWGTPNAKAVTLSFWVNSTIAGTFSGCIINYASNRSFPFSYSIPTANTWIKITVPIFGDPNGTWVMYGNGGSLYVRFDLGSGATYRTTAGAWVNGNYTGVTGTGSWVSTNGAGVYITGVKLETGSVASPFDRQSLAKSMADCQRYYQVLLSMLFGSWQAASTAFYSGYSYNTVMRAAPTGVFSNFGYANASALGANAATTNIVQLTAIATAAGYAWASGNVALSAEL
jgi:hypothetical protein